MSPTPNHVEQGAGRGRRNVILAVCVIVVLAAATVPIVLTLKSNDSAPDSPEAAYIFKLTGPAAPVKLSQRQGKISIRLDPTTDLDPSLHVSWGVSENVKIVTSEQSASSLHADIEVDGNGSALVVNAVVERSEGGATVWNGSILLSYYEVKGSVVFTDTLCESEECEFATGTMSVKSTTIKCTPVVAYALPPVGAVLYSKTCQRIGKFVQASDSVALKVMELSEGVEISEVFSHAHISGNAMQPRMLSSGREAHVLESSVMSFLKKTFTAQAGVSGDVTFEFAPSFDYSLRLSLAVQPIEEIKMVATGTMKMGFNVVIEAGLAAEWEKELPVLSIPEVAAFLIPLEVPVEIVIGFDLKLSISVRGRLNAKISTSSGLVGEASLGGRYTKASGAESLNSMALHTSHESAELKTTCEVTADIKVQPELTFKFYGAYPRIIVGPVAEGRVGRVFPAPESAAECPCVPASSSPGNFEDKMTLIAAASGGVDMSFYSKMFTKEFSSWDVYQKCAPLDGGLCTGVCSCMHGDPKCKCWPCSIPQNTSAPSPAPTSASSSPDVNDTSAPESSGSPAPVVFVPTTPAPTGGALEPTRWKDIASLSDKDTYYIPASLKGGGHAVAWHLKGRNTVIVGTLHVTLFSPEGANLSTVAVADNTLRAFCVSGFPSGGFVVVWRDKEQFIKGAVYNVVGTQMIRSAQITIALRTINLYDVEFFGRVQVLCLSDGSFVVSYPQDTTISQEREELHVIQFSAIGDELSRTVLVDTSNQRRHSMCSMETGFVISFSVWHYTGNINDQSYFAIFHTNDASSSQNVSVNVGVQSRVACLEGGGVVAAWSHSDGATFVIESIYAMTFDSSFSPSSGVMVVNNYAVDSLDDRLTVTSLPHGGFVVAWEGYKGVYARQYDKSGSPVSDEFEVAFHEYYVQQPESARHGSGFVMYFSEDDGLVGCIYNTTLSLREQSDHEESILGLFRDDSCYDYAGEALCKTNKQLAGCGSPDVWPWCKKTCNVCGIRSTDEKTQAQYRLGPFSCQDALPTDQCKQHKENGECKLAEVWTWCRETCGMPCSSVPGDQCRNYPEPMSDFDAGTLFQHANGTPYPDFNSSGYVADDVVFIFPASTPVDSPFSCDIVKQSGKCSERPHICLKTCDHCPTDYSPCRDNEATATCSSHKQTGNCADPSVWSVCRLTCDRCGVSLPMAKHQITPCEDTSLRQLCHLAQRYGHCDNTATWSTCSKSCQLC